MNIEKYLDLDGLSYFWGKVKSYVVGLVNTKYTKPAGGIPSSDIASGVVPSISTNIEADATNNTKTASPKAVKDYVDSHGGGGGVTDVTVGGVSVVTQGVAAVPAIPDTTDFIEKSQTAGLVKNDGTIDTTQYGTYSKPSGGIPSTDLASAVQTSLGKADTALQSYTETDPVFSASAASGITSSDIAEWDGKAEPTPVVDASTIPSSMESNKLYKYGTLSGNTVFPPFATPTDLTIANVYWWKFTTPSTAPNITWPAGITEWAGGQAPNIDASTTYEITVEDGLASYIKS